MADHSKIEWTETTWNVVTGCTKISAGCDHCYIERTPPFRMAGRRFDKPGTGGTTGVVLHDDRLGLPLRWRKPRRIFVCSLADLFHQAVPARFIASVFATMVAAPQHTFQVLTKRHARLRSLLCDERFWQMVSAEMGRLWGTPPPAPLACVPEWIWVGVSVESQEWADRRIPALLDVPAAVRWLSCEPLLGPVDLTNWLTDPHFNPAYRVARCGQQSAHSPHVMEHGPDQPRNCPGTGDSPYWPRCLDWAVIGGESGPGARPMALAWVSSLIQQCRSAGVTPFVKQMGSVWARDWRVGGEPIVRRDPKGGDWQHWPAGLRVREYPTVAGEVPA